METEVSVAYSTVHQTLSFDDNVSTFSFKKSVTVNVRACLIIGISISNLHGYGYPANNQIAYDACCLCVE